MKRIIALIALLIALLMSCNGSSSGIKPGSTVFVTEQCIGAINEDSFDEMTKYCGRKDEVGLEIMEGKGLIKILEKGESGVVTDMGFGKIKIRLEDRSEYWCASEFIK